MAMNITDRILTVVVTATLTSAVWIVGGGSFMRYAEDQNRDDLEEAVEAAEESGANVPKALPSDQPPPTELEVTEPENSETRQLLVPILNMRRDALTNTFTSESGEGERLHEALDIPAELGAVVIAAAPGTIEKLFQSETGGLTVFVRSNDRKTIHYYAQMGEYAEGLQEGQRIRRGQRLGMIGEPTLAEPTGPHLHFAILRTSPESEWWEPATAINPYPLLSGQK